MWLHDTALPEAQKQLPSIAMLSNEYRQGKCHRKKGITTYHSKSNFMFYESDAAVTRPYILTGTSWFSSCFSGQSRLHIRPYPPTRSHFNVVPPCVTYAVKRASLHSLKTNKSEIQHGLEFEDPKVGEEETREQKVINLHIVQWNANKQLDKARYAAHTAQKLHLQVFKTERRV